MIEERITEAVAKVKAMAPAEALYKVYLRPGDFALLLHEHGCFLQAEGKLNQANHARGYTMSVDSLRQASGKYLVQGIEVHLREEYGHSAVVAMLEDSRVAYAQLVW